MRIVAFLPGFILNRAWAWADNLGDAIEMRSILEKDSELPFYSNNTGSSNRRDYAEVIKGDNYTISVRNRLDKREYGFSLTPLLI
jgi:hypothetical protein